MHADPQLPICADEAAAAGAWQGARPRYEVIPLDCEITAYAPDGDGPLF